MFFLLFLCGLLTMNTNILALNEKFCVNCKHFIGVIGCSDKLGRCKLFPKKTDNNEEWDYLVTGNRKVEYKFCSYAREDPESCGASGKYYMKKKILFPRIKEFVKNKVCFVKNNIYIDDSETENE